MTEMEKIALIEDIMELDEGTLKADSVLADFEEWDSITALSIISMMDEEFGKTITGAEVKAFETVADILKIME
ncbi:MAG: acyl carrier protein [Huintestinicola sp.]